MRMHVSLILNICTVSAFDLFPNQDKVLIGSVSVDLLWESTPEPGGRDRRSALILPGQLAFQFSMGGEKVELNLKRNPDLNTHTPAFVVRGGQVVSGSQHGEPHTKDIMGYYQDVSKAAAIMVKREVRDQAQYELMGTYIMAEEQYTIQPLRVDHGDGSGQRIANHSIARLMTHLSLRNDILDFVRDPTTEDIAASNKRSVTEESPANRRRHKRQATVNRVELLIVTDYAVYATWFERTKGSSRAERRHRALENMKQYYAFVINGIDLRYASIKEPDFRIDVTFAGIVMIDDPQESLWTVNLAGAQDGGGEFVESSDALESFRSWVLNNDTSFPPNDHVMLFTGYNLTYGGSTANAGLAYIKSMCNPEFSISIVEEFFEFRIVAIAAHELGHSLGARHDMDGNKCFAFFLYIMTSRFRFPSRSKATNPWRFSKCSIDYFRKYIETLNSNNTNCMLTQDANTDINEIAGFLGDQPGQVYSPDKQCEVKFQSEDSHVCRDGHKDRYTNICSQGMLCRVPGGGGACERIVPADGTPCEKGKWCMGGSCVASTDMLEWTDGCPFGDTPGVVRGAETCQDLVTADPRVCYNDTVRLKCCDTCVTVHTGIAGCDYGDRQRDCQADLCPSYTFDIQNVSCCATCHNFFNPTTPTTPGPSTTPTTTTPPLTVSLLTTLAVGDVARGSTGTALASSGPFESMGDVSTKSEKLMKSELMPTSEIAVTMTTRDTVMTTEQPRVYTSTFSTQGQTRRSTGETAFPGVHVSSKSPPGSSKGESLMTPTTASIPGSSNGMATLIHFVTSPRTVQSPPTSMNTLRQSTTRTTSSTESPNTGTNSGGVPSSNIGGIKEMTRKRKLAKLRQLRELHLRQRQAAVRRQWLYYYTLLTRSRYNWRWRPTGRMYGRGRQRLGRLHQQTFSWEHSMEEMENDEDTDVGVGGRERRSVQSYVGNMDVEGGRRSGRQSVTADDNAGSDGEIRHEPDTKDVVLAIAMDTHGLDADSYNSGKNGLNDDVSTPKYANSEKYTGSTSCQGMCNHILRMDPLTTDHNQGSPSNDRGRHVEVDDGGVSATETDNTSDAAPMNTVPMVTVPLLPSVPPGASLKRISDSLDYDEVTSTFTPVQSVTNIGVTMNSGDPMSGKGNESIWFSSKPTFPQTKPVTAKDKLKGRTVNPSRGGKHSHSLPSSTPDVSTSVSSNYKLSSPSSSSSSTASPDFLLLHKPRSGGTRDSWVSGVRLKYNVIDISKNTEGKDHGSWIFHAMINPGMIPIQTRLINLQQKRRPRMMPFDGELVRGKSKGEKKPKRHRKETVKSDAKMESVDMNIPGKLRPSLSATEDTRGLMTELSSKGEDTQPNVRNVPWADKRVFNTIVREQNKGETILASRDEHGREDPANLGDGNRVVVDHGREDPAHLGDGNRVVVDHPPLAVYHTSRDNSDEISKDMYLMEDAEDDSFEDLEEEHPPGVGFGSTAELRSLPGTGQLVKSHQPRDIMSRYRKWDSHVGMPRQNWVLKGNEDVREIGNGERGEASVGRGVKPTGDLIR